jgi:hypothetical protein
MVKRPKRAPKQPAKPERPSADSAGTGTSGPPGKLRFTELAELHEKRRRFTNWFIRRQRRISFERRQWLGITEMADEYAKEPGSLEVNADRRDRFIDTVRLSILSNEFVKNGRSQVLNVHPSGHAQNRFDPAGATELFNPIVGYLYISRTQWSEWLGRLGVEIPRFPTTSVKAAREAPSLPTAEDNPQVEQLNLREPPRLIDLPEEKHPDEPTTTDPATGTSERPVAVKKRTRRRTARPPVEAALQSLYGNNVPSLEVVPDEELRVAVENQIKAETRQKLYPDGPPPGLTERDLDMAVVKELKAQKVGWPISLDTVRRASGRRVDKPRCRNKPRRTP